MFNSMSLLQVAPGANLTLPRAPEWEGWLALGILVTLFSFLGWWLFLSPLPVPVRPAPLSASVLRARRWVAGLMFSGGLLGFVGTNWDELWHRLYGGFGSDFLWPPHLMIYGSLALNGVFAALGLLLAFRGQGGLRERFRREPLLGLLGLISAYQVASIPSDQLWHQIIGPDLTAWSLPHWLLMVTTSGSRLAGLAIGLSSVPRESWRSLGDRPRGMQLVAVGLLAEATLGTLQFVATEFEWADPTALRRPEWSYPVLVLVAGILLAHVALYATRRIGAATAMVLLALLGHAAVVWTFWHTLGHGPVIGAHLLILPPALLLDLWYAVRQHGRRTTGIRWIGILIYGVTFLLVALPYISAVLPALRPGLAANAASVVLGLAGAMGAGVLGATLGTWLGTLGRDPVQMATVRRPAGTLSRQAA